MTETNLETLIRTLVTPLVKHPDAVRITESETDRYHRYVLDVHPAEAFEAGQLADFVMIRVDQQRRIT